MVGRDQDASFLEASPPTSLRANQQQLAYGLPSFAAGLRRHRLGAKIKKKEPNHNRYNEALHHFLHPEGFVLFPSHLVREVLIPPCPLPPHCDLFIARSCRSITLLSTIIDPFAAPGPSLPLPTLTLRPSPTLRRTAPGREALSRRPSTSRSLMLRISSIPLPATGRTPPTGTTWTTCGSSRSRGSSRST